MIHDPTDGPMPGDHDDLVRRADPEPGAAPRHTLIRHPWVRATLPTTRVRLARVADAAVDRRAA